MASKESTQRRAQRIRRQIKEVASDRLRLSVYRSSKNIHAQIIDDSKGHTVAAASSLEKDLKGSLKTGADVAAAAAVGKLHRRARHQGRRQGSRLRSRPVHLSRPRQGAGRSRPRGRPELLIFAPATQSGAGYHHQPCFRKRTRNRIWHRNVGTAAASAAETVKSATASSSTSSSTSTASPRSSRAAGASALQRSSSSATRRAASASATARRAKCRRRSARRPRAPSAN